MIVPTQYIPLHLFLSQIVEVSHGKQCERIYIFIPGKLGMRIYTLQNALVGQHPKPFEADCIGLRLCEPFRKIT